MAITSTPGPIAGQTTLPEITTTGQATGDTGARAPVPTGETESGRGRNSQSQNDRGPALRVELSEEAEALLASHKAPGKSGNSPAQLARSLQASAGEAGGEFKNFGQLVSSIARGVFSLAAPSDEGGEAVDGEGGSENPEGGAVIGSEEPSEGSGPQVQILEESAVEIFQAASAESAVAPEVSLVEPELSLSDTPVLPGLEAEAVAVEESLLEELLEASATPSSDS